MMFTLDLLSYIGTYHIYTNVYYNGYKTDENRQLYFEAFY